MISLIEFMIKETRVLNVSNSNKSRKRQIKFEFLMETVHLIDIRYTQLIKKSEQPAM
jgi:hypothetical protein